MHMALHTLLQRRDDSAAETKRQRRNAVAPLLHRVTGSGRDWRGLADPHLGGLALLLLLLPLGLGLGLRLGARVGLRLAPLLLRLAPGVRLRLGLPTTGMCSGLQERGIRFNKGSKNGAQPRAWCRSFSAWRLASASALACGTTGHFAVLGFVLKRAGGQSR